MSLPERTLHVRNLEAIAYGTDPETIRTVMDGIVVAYSTGQSGRIVTKTETFTVTWCGMARTDSGYYLVDIERVGRASPPAHAGSLP